MHTNLVPNFTINATSELILSAGAFGTPNILLHSGIGDAAELAALGIESIVNNSHVGKNLQDHVLLTNVYSVNDSASFSLDEIQQNGTFRDELIAQWKIDHSGELSLIAASQLGWYRNAPNLTTIDGIPDPR